MRQRRWQGSTTAVVLAMAMTACAAPRPQLLDGMGPHGCTVSTTDAEAQRWFDQGLMLCYGFNHDEGERSFATAAELDPQLAMAFWGQAYAAGPNYNLPLDEARGRRAWAAIERARALASHATQKERDLIEALATRFDDPPSPERAHLDRAYADSMGRLWAKYPDDTDIGVLYADALLNLSPWDQWTKDGRPKANTETVVATLERVLQLDPNHPGAIHYYIHTMEASPWPERAEGPADRLGALAPGLGHLVHMPSHIYVQTGRFADSIECNRKASQVDVDYFARAGQQGIYHTYHAHNDHFLIWSAMFAGRYEEALQGCRDLVAHLPEAFHGDPAVAEWLVTDAHVHVRFGKWNEVLAMDSPRQDQPYALAMWHFARGVALANLGRIDEARQEQQAFEREAVKVPAEQMVFIVPAQDVLAVGREMMAGEIAYKAGDVAAGFRHLRAAVAAEDALRYSEPNPWMMPVRHALGALLLEQGQVAEAERCYREDLAHYPGNGWSLNGLAECLERRDAVAEAATVRAQFERAWADATVSICGSCFCRTGDE
ncbi:MAG: hypothetical protein AB7O97_14460 [Planctomycetota bacterium]